MRNNFYYNTGPYTVKNLAAVINAEIVGDEKLEIHNVKSLQEASVQDLSFLENKKYLSSFEQTNAGACIVNKDHDETINKNVTLLKVDNPYFAYAQILDLFYKTAKPNNPGISANSQIASTAKIGQNCTIGAGAVIEDNVEIGDNSIIGPAVYIDYGVIIGKNARIDANTTISHAQIGDDVVILSGARIGQDGFGFATNRGVHKKILHIGKVIIGNNVEVGANSCIDRGSMSDTIIEDLCRIDNLVQIGHNTHIKMGSVIVSQVGIAGSTTIGKYCVIGGQAGISGHLMIADQTQIAGQAGVMQNITETSSAVGGSPAVPIRDWHKQSVILKKLIKKK